MNLSGVELAAISGIIVALPSFIGGLFVGARLVRITLFNQSAKSLRATVDIGELVRVLLREAVAWRKEYRRQQAALTARNKKQSRH